VWCAACLSGCVFVSADLNPFRSRPEGLVETTVSGTGKEKVLLIELGQLISSVPPRSLLGMEQRPSVLARIREELEVAEKDPRVRAVVLRINSPGGTVTASDTLYHELAAFRSRTGRPLVAHIGEVGTSGAYYAALAADEIIASPTSVTGSVGVLWMGVNVAGLMQKFGIEDQTLKAGELKDAGSPLRPMSERERALLQGLLEAMHKRFLATVRERRPGMPEGALEKVGDGRVVYADEARSLGLVDGIGYLEDAIARARERAGLARARVVMYRRPSQYAENIYSLAGVTGGDVNLFRLDVGLLWGRGDFYYLWSPGLQAGEGAITYP
jgi:protease-4